MITVREILLGAPGDAAKAMAGMAGAMAGKDLPPGPAARAVLERVSSLLEFEPGDILIQAWKARSALHQAALETKALPGTSKKVVLSVYSIPWDYAMDLEIRMAHRVLAKMQAILTLDLEVTALSAIVTDGKLTTLDGGECRVTATLELQHIPVISREHLFSLPYEIKVGNGIDLL